MTNWMWLGAFWVLGSVVAMVMAECFESFKYEESDPVLKCQVIREPIWARLVLLFGSWLFVLIVFMADKPPAPEPQPDDEDFRIWSKEMNG